jgi:GNAT superfamily N-acetyltransferase
MSRAPGSPPRGPARENGSPGVAPTAPPAVGLASGVQLRAATAADQRAIRGLIRRARINPIGLDWHRFVVVEEPGGGIVACGQVKPHSDGARELASVAVAEGWRGKGLARVIIETMKHRAGPPLWLTCREGLVPMYARFGFVRVTARGELTPYFRRLDRVARQILRLFRPGEGLAIMVWQESCTTAEAASAGG